MGETIAYEAIGASSEKGFAGSHDNQTFYTERELDVHETHRDLYWWYRKQDAYQSLLGGGRLL